MDRLPVSETGVLEPRFLRKAAHLGVRARGLGCNHLVTEIARVPLHRRHHLEADALALKAIGNRDGEITMPCSRIVGVSGFADDRALPFLRDLGEQRSEERRVGKEGRSRWSPYH